MASRVRNKLKVSAADLKIRPEKHRYEVVPLSWLKPNPKNANKHPKRQIRELVRAFGEVGVISPPIVDPDGTILAGHGRYEAAQQCGLSEMAVIIVEGKTPAQLRAYALADNKLGTMSSLDLKLVLEEIDAIGVEDPTFDITLTGFHTAEIDAMFGAHRTVELNDLEDNVPELLKRVPVTLEGDLWLLDEHRVICGDCTEHAVMDQLINSRQVRIVLEDVPYNLKIEGVVSGLGRNHHSDFKMAAGEMSPNEYIAFLSRAIDTFVPHLVDGAMVLLFIDWRHVAEMLSAGAATGLDLRNILVWVKDNAGMGSMWRSQHELVIAFKHGEAAHVNNVELGRHGRHRSNVLQYTGMNSFTKGRSKALQEHATVKPVALIADLILDASNRGDVVLDGFGGSGTTLVAAEKMGRLAYLAEIEPSFVDVTLERWEALTGKSAVHAQSGRSFADIRRERLGDVSVGEA